MAIMNTVSIQKKIQKTPIVGYVTNDTNNSSTTDAPSVDAMKKYVKSQSSGSIEIPITSIKRNGVELPIVDKSVDILVPTRLSELTNDSGYITNTVGNLTNYYTKTQTYTKSEVDEKIKDIPSTDLSNYYTKAEVNGISSLTNYYLKTQTYNKTEIDKKIADIPSTDLSNYYTKTEVNNITTLANYYPKTSTYTKDEVTNVSNLKNYYTKSNTYNKEEVNQLVSGVKPPTVDTSTFLKNNIVNDLEDGFKLSYDGADTGLVVGKKTVSDIEQLNFGNTTIQSVVNSKGRLLLNDGTKTNTVAYNSDLGNYYTKSETYPKSQVYNKTEVNGINNLTNYYTKSLTYNKTEVDNKIKAIPTVDTSKFVKKNGIQTITEDFTLSYDGTNDNLLAGLYAGVFQFGNGKYDVNINSKTRPSVFINGSSQGEEIAYRSEIPAPTDLSNYYTKAQVDAKIPTVPTKTSQLTNDSGYIKNTVSNLTNYYTKTQTYTKEQVDALIPSIPTVPTKLSQLTNDTGFITNGVSNLTNYYTKTQTYTKSEVDEKIPSVTNLIKNSGYNKINTVFGLSFDGTANNLLIGQTGGNVDVGSSSYNLTFTSKSRPTVNGSNQVAYLSDIKTPTIDRTTILNMVYPVGAIYISINNTNPSTFIGGTWVAFGTGRTLVGVDTTQSEFSTVEKQGGSKTVTLTKEQLPTHNHNTTVSTTADHSHKGQTTANGTHAHSITCNSAGAHTHSVSGNTDTLGGHSHKANLADTAGSSTISNVPSIQRSSWTTANKKAWQDSTLLLNSGVHKHTITATAASTGSHTHTCSSNNTGTHNHTLEIGEAGAHTHTVSVLNTGSGNAHNNLQPYITVYMFKRTA